MAASLTEATIIVSIMPTSTASACSITRGTISCLSALFENIRCIFIHSSV